MSDSPKEPLLFAVMWRYTYGRAVKINAVHVLCRITPSDGISCEHRLAISIDHDEYMHSQQPPDSTRACATSLNHRPYLDNPHSSHPSARHKPCAGLEPFEIAQVTGRAS